MDSEVTKPLLLLDKEGSNINIPIRSCGMGCDVQNLTKNKEVRSLGTQILEEGSSIIDIPKRPCGMVCEFSDVENRTKDKEVRSAATQKLVIATGLCLVFIAVEVGGGLIANSLAILTDAAHLLSDVAGFGISLFAIWAASWQATPRQSYGFFRLEILGALLSIQLIWLLTGILVYEAIDRICHTRQPINGCLMFIIASFGFCVNLIMAFLLGHHGHSHGNHDGHHDHSHANKHDHHGHSHGNEHDHDHNHLNVETSGNNGLKGKLGHSGQIHPVRTDDSDIADVHDHHNCQRKHPNKKLKDGDVERGSISQECADDSNINVRGAYLHVLGDLIQSIGVMIGGAVIWAKPEWIIVDLICTLLFSLLVLGTTIKMLRDIVEILMESTPRGIDTCILEKGLCSIPGVKDVHDLHIWAITMGKTSLACHVTIESDADADAILQDAVQFCESVFKISHSTVQIERNTSL